MYNFSVRCSENINAMQMNALVMTVRNLVTRHPLSSLKELAWEIGHLLRAKSSRGKITQSWEPSECNAEAEIEDSPSTTASPTVLYPTQQTSTTDARLYSFNFLPGTLELYSARTAQLSPYRKPCTVPLLTFIHHKVLLSTKVPVSYQLKMPFPREYHKTHSLMSVCLPSQLTGLLQAERQVWCEWFHLSFST